MYSVAFTASGPSYSPMLSFLNWSRQFKSNRSDAYENVEFILLKSSVSKSASAGTFKFYDIIDPELLLAGMSI